MWHQSDRYELEGEEEVVVEEGDEEEDMEE